MKKIIYLHGFGSTGNSSKVQALRAALGDDNVIAPDLPIDPRSVRALVDDLIRQNANSGVVLVGTSLGGFYAWYFSQRWDIPCILVNPSTRPSTTVGQRTGVFKNYVTGEQFNVYPEFADIWAEMETEALAEQNGKLINLFVAKDDDVIPYTRALKDIPFTDHLLVSPDGGHRFEQHWADVVHDAKVLTGA